MKVIKLKLLESKTDSFTKIIFWADCTLIWNGSYRVQEVLTNLSLILKQHSYIQISKYYQKVLIKKKELSSGSGLRVQKRTELGKTCDWKFFVTTHSFAESWQLEYIYMRELNITKLPMKCFFSSTKVTRAIQARNLPIFH